MEIVPLLHIKDGQPLVGRPGAWRPAPTPYPDGGSDLADLARHLGVRFGSVCLVDLGTGRSDEPHLNLYQRLVKHNVRVWVDAFPGTLEDVMDQFIAGADRVTVRLDAFDLGDLEEVLQIADGEVWLGLPFQTLDGLDALVRKTDPARYLASGASGSVLMDLTTAGTARGGDPEVLAHAPQVGPVFLSGGLHTPQDAEVLKEAGADGVFVGNAILTDTDVWAKKAQDERGGAGPRVVGTSTADVTVDQRQGFLPGVLPDRPGRPRVEDRDPSRD